MLNNLFFGFDIASVTNNVFYVLLIMIGFDILTGLLVAGRERKINSSINFDGLIRKLGLITGLFFVTFIDSYFKTNGVLVATSVGLLIIYEGMSVIENLAKIGVNLNFIAKYFDKKKVTLEKEGENVE